MYYLVQEKNEHGTYEVWSPRHIKDSGSVTILYTFTTWDDVMSYMTNPIDWVTENLSEEFHYD